MYLQSHECHDYVLGKWNELKDGNPSEKTYTYQSALENYKKIEMFAPDGHITDNNEQIDNDTLLLIRLITEYHILQAFKGMKIDTDNSNVASNLEKGNIGTPGRIAKIWCGSNINDDRELGGGRFSKKPRMAAFPNMRNYHEPVTKKIDIISNCSHHFIPFSSIARPDSYAVVSYIPDNYLIGISKLQRVANWISQRFYLQEDLTKALFNEISKVARTESVYIGLFNLTHGCETFRGSKSKNGTLTTDYAGGEFKINPNLIPKE